MAAANEFEDVPLLAGAASAESHLYIIGPARSGKTAFIKRALFGLKPDDKCDQTQVKALHRALTLEGARLLTEKYNIRFYERNSASDLPPPDTHNMMFVVYMAYSESADSLEEDLMSQAEIARELRQTYNVAFAPARCDQWEPTDKSEAYEEARLHFKCPLKARPKPGAKIDQDKVLQFGPAINQLVSAELGYGVEDLLGWVTAKYWDVPTRETKNGSELLLFDLIAQLNRIYDQCGNVVVAVRGHSGALVHPMVGITYDPGHNAMSTTMGVYTDRNNQHPLLIMDCD